MKSIIVKLTLREEALGMTPGDEAAFDSFLEYRKTKLGIKNAKLIDDAKKAEELEGLRLALEEQKVEKMEKGVDIFPFDDKEGKYYFFDFQMRGFFKDSLKALKDCVTVKKAKEEGEENEEEKKIAEKVRNCKEFECLRNFKKQPGTWVDRGIFVGPRKVFITLPEGGKTAFCQRTLRVDKFPQSQNTLKSSMSVPAESTIKFRIGMLNDADEKIVLACLHYGYLRGVGEWRNSGKGTFTFAIYDEAKGIWVPQEPVLERELKLNEVLPE